MGWEFEDIAEQLDKIITKGEVLKDNDRATLKFVNDNGDIFKVGLKGNWKGEETKNKWIITAYKDEREMAKTIDSSDFTKGETLPLNSNEIIAEKYLIDTLKEMQDKDVNVRLGDKDLLELYEKSSREAYDLLAEKLRLDSVKQYRSDAYALFENLSLGADAKGSFEAILRKNIRQRQLENFQKPQNVKYEIQTEQGFKYYLDENNEVVINHKNELIDFKGGVVRTKPDKDGDILELNGILKLISPRNADNWYLAKRELTNDEFYDFHANLRLANYYQNGLFVSDEKLYEVFKNMPRNADKQGLDDVMGILRGLTRSKNVNIAYAKEFVDKHYGLEADYRALARDIFKRVDKEYKKNGNPFGILFNDQKAIEDVRDVYGDEIARDFFKGKNAVDFLLYTQAGHIQNAFYKEGLGDIDVVWGDDSLGLKHIIDKHGGEFEDIAKELDEIIQNGEVVKTHNGYNITLGDYKVGLNIGWNENGVKIGENKWVVTAFDNSKLQSEKQGSNSASFTKGETLPLNSEEIIPQKHLIDTLKDMQDKDLNVKLGDKDLLDLYANASRDIVQNMENASFDLDFIHQIKQYNDNLFAFFEKNPQFKELSLFKNFYNHLQNIIRKKQIENFTKPLNSKTEISTKSGNIYYFDENHNLLKNPQEKPIKKDEIVLNEKGDTLLLSDTHLALTNKNKDFKDRYIHLLTNTDKREVLQFANFFQNGLTLENKKLFDLFKSIPKAAFMKYPLEILMQIFNDIVPNNKATIPFYAEFAKKHYGSVDNFNKDFLQKMDRQYKENGNPFGILFNDEVTIKEFGKEYFKGKNAIDFLLKAQAGHIENAFYKEGLGDIDLVWGDDSFGLKHIIDKHGDEFEDIAKDLSEAVENGVLKKQNEVRSRIEFKDFVIGLSSEFNGEKKGFIITPFKRKGEISTLSPKQDFTDKSDDVLSNPESIMPQKANLEAVNKQKDKELLELYEKADFKGKCELIKEDINEEIKALEKQKEEFKRIIQQKDYHDIELEQARKILDNAKEEVEGHYRIKYMQDGKEMGFFLSKYDYSKRALRTKDEILHEIIKRTMYGDKITHIEKTINRLKRQIKIIDGYLKEYGDNESGAISDDIIEKFKYYNFAKDTPKGGIIIGERQKGLYEQAQKVLNSRFLKMKRGAQKSSRDYNITYDEARKLFYKGDMSEEQKALFESVLPIAQKLNVRIRTAIREPYEDMMYSTKDASGLYRYSLNTATLKKGAGLSDTKKAQVLLHELIHSVTSRAMSLHKTPLRDKMLSKTQIRAIDEIEQIYKKLYKFRKTFKLQDENGEPLYGLTNMHEMLAELANPMFSSKLKEIGLYEKVINNIMKIILSVRDFIRLRSDKNVYEKLKQCLKDIIENYKDDFTQEYEKQNIRDFTLTSQTQKEQIYTQRQEIKNTLKAKINQAITNENTGEKAILTNKGISKMTSDKAIQKSVDNGFSREEHLRAVEVVDELFKRAKKALSKIDEKDKNLSIYRYNAPFENANALMTLKEYKQNGKRIYSLELESLEAVKFNPSGKDLTEQSSKSKDADTTTFHTPIDNPSESIAQKSENIYHSNPHLGAGLLGGSLNGIEQDENGNLTFDPVKFAAGFLGASLGSKAVSMGFKHLEKNPALKEKIITELADTLAQGFEKAREKYPLLSTLKPRYIVQNERGRKIQAKVMLKELKREQKGLFNVAYNGKNATMIKQDLESVENAIALMQGTRYKGAKHERIKHLTDPSKEGYVTDLEFVNLGKSIREFLKHYEPFIDKNGSRIYEWEKDGVRFRVVVNDIADMDSNPTTATKEIITFYSDRNLKEAMGFKNPALKQTIIDVKKMQKAREKEHFYSTFSLQDVLDNTFIKLNNIEDRYYGSIQINPKLKEGEYHISSNRLYLNKADFNKNKISDEAIRDFLKSLRLLENNNRELWEAQNIAYKHNIPLSRAKKVMQEQKQYQKEIPLFKEAMERFKEFEPRKIKDLLEWHKDSSALTKDEQGLPRVFYHGSGARFEVFKKEFDETNLGFWFSPDDNTSIYGKEKYPVFLKGDFLDLTKKETYLLNLFHKITPEIKNIKTKNLELFIREIMDKKNIAEKFKTFLKSYGINGIVINERMFVVFNPNQIKHIDNKGSYTDTSGKISKNKPKNSEAEHKYFNENSENIYYSNPHIGAGLLGGSLNGIEQDENGNLTFDPVKFAAGFLGASLGSKAVSMGFKHLEKNPALKEKIITELADTLAQGFEKAREKYPLLSTLKPRYIVKNKHGREIQSRALLREIKAKNKKTG